MNEFVHYRGQGNEWDAHKGKDTVRGEQQGDEKPGLTVRIANRVRRTNEKSKRRKRFGVNAKDTPELLKNSISIPSLSTDVKNNNSRDRRAAHADGDDPYFILFGCFKPPHVLSNLMKRSFSQRGTRDG